MHSFTHLTLLFHKCTLRSLPVETHPYVLHQLVSLTRCESDCRASRQQRNVWNVCILQPTSTWSVHFPFIPDQVHPPFSFPVILIFHCIPMGCRGPTGPTSITLWHSHSADCAIGWGYARYWTGRGKHSNNEMISEPIIQMVHCFKQFN